MPSWGHQRHLTHQVAFPVAHYGKQHKAFCGSVFCLCWRQGIPPFTSWLSLGPRPTVHLPSLAWVLQGLGGLCQYVLMSERTTQDLKTTLGCVAAENPNSWSTHLVWVDYSHNSLTCSATGLSPFEASLGF